MIFYILLIIFIIIHSKGIYDINKISLESEILTLQNGNEMDIKSALKNLYPLLIYNFSSRNNILRELTLEKIIQNNPGYIINDNSKNISLDFFLNEKYPQMSVYQNTKLPTNFGIQSSLDEIIKPFCNVLSCNIIHSMNIFKGNQITDIQEQKDNICIISQLQNNSIFYLFHPKYKKNILHKDLSKIKKWANKIIIEPGVVLSIPPNWFYFYESQKISMTCKSTCDEYNSYLYNLIK